MTRNYLSTLRSYYKCAANRESMSIAQKLIFPGTDFGDYAFGNVEQVTLGWHLEPRTELFWKAHDDLWWSPSLLKIKHGDLTTIIIYISRNVMNRMKKMCSYSWNIEWTSGVPVEHLSVLENDWPRTMSQSKIGALRCVTPAYICLMCNCIR